MANFDLLDAILPEGGWYCAIALSGDFRVQDHFKTRQEVTDFAKWHTSQDRNVFFATAKYKTDHNRTKDNVLALQAFWIDLDCGEDKAAAGKGYLTQGAALAALQGFCEATGLPRPALVNSGGGIHAYWPLTAPVSREEWEPVAEQFRDLTYAHGLLVDRVVFEVARILRMPGTLNFKRAVPTAVSVIAPANPIKFTHFCKLVGAQKPVVPSTPKNLPAPSGKGTTQLGQALARKPDASFGKIITRADGCGQLRYCVQHREKLEEPLWFAALSVANKCTDRDRAIQALSFGHPDYDPHDAEAKASRTTGPARCGHFDGLNPAICNRCPHFGKITSPIQLGGDHIAPPQAKEATVETVNAGTVTYRIPDYPNYYFRPEEGGVWRKHKHKDGTVEDVMVYPYDLHITRRMSDPDAGQCFMARLVEPHDGVKEFLIYGNKLADKGEIRRELFAAGVFTDDKTYPHLHAYITGAVNLLQAKRKAEVMHNQLGWTKDNKSFVLGDTEYHIGGAETHSPPSAATADIAKHMHTKGSLDVWKSIAELYNQPGLEPHMFAILAGFGSILFQFTGQRGAAINVIHPNSGTGKTTIINMANSIMGDPDGLNMVSQDTVNSRVHKIGVFRSLLYCVDEITNISPMVASELVYGISNGKGKDRMEASGNRLRPNNTTWSLIGLFSSNASMYERLSIKKASPEGEMMRLIEYKIEHKGLIDPAIAKEAFDVDLKKNYGWAGVVFIRYIVRNSPYAIALLKQVQQKMDRELRLHPRERHWSAMIASIIVGGMLARECKLLNWNIAEIYRWSITLVSELRKDTALPLLEGNGALGEYLNSSVQNTLVVSMTSGLNKAPELVAISEPRGPLHIRHEKHTQRLYVAVKHFRDYCAERDINYKETVRMLEQERAVIGREAKRLAPGWSAISTPVRCLVMDTQAEAFTGIALTPKATV